jgi:hypothetical protein
MQEPKLKISQRTLPHWELDGSVYFVTFNTSERLELTPPARQVVFDACRFFENQRYQIFAFLRLCPTSAPSGSLSAAITSFATTKSLQPFRTISAKIQLKLIYQRLSENIHFSWQSTVSLEPTLLDSLWQQLSLKNSK